MRETKQLEEIVEGQFIQTQLERQVAAVISTEIYLFRPEKIYLFRFEQKLNLVSQRCFLRKKRFFTPCSHRAIHLITHFFFYSSQLIH